MPMKYTRLIVGLGAIIFALWVIVGEQMSGASANAVVNAPVVTVRAPVAGNLQISARQLGSSVSQGVVLASIQDPLVDAVRLDDLLMEVQLEAAARLQIETLLSETRDLQQNLIERSRSYQINRLEELREQLSYAEERLAILEEADLPENTDQRLLDTVERDANRIPGEPRLEALILNHAQERVATLRIAVRSAEQNIFLGDGYNDSPNSGQRVVELESEIASLASQLTEATARYETLVERVNRERIRVNRFTGNELVSPVNGIYWDILEGNGINVQRGDPLIRIVNCDATIVTLSVTERIYNSLSVGQPATFRLGGTTRVYDATISRLAGSGAATIYQTLAVAPSERHLERFDVSLLVPELRDDASGGCMIGKTGRAFFENRPLDWLRGVFQ